MKNYISFVLIALSTQLIVCEDVIEQAIKDINPVQLEKIFSPNVVLRASDKERYVKLAREIAESLRQAKSLDTTQHALNSENLRRALWLAALFYGGVLPICFGGLGVFFESRKQEHLAESREMIGLLSIATMFSGCLSTWVSILKLKEHPKSIVYIRACAALKMLEDVPVAKE
jgi:hypothetical protein